MTGPDLGVSHSHAQLLTLPGVGKASSCAAYGSHRPTPLRFIWHHVLPQVCGGPTVAANLVSLCDSCHYTTHILLWELANSVPWTAGTRSQRALARRGYDAAVTAGTVAKIPKEA